MTTGRINQVTIVRRGDGQLLVFQGRRDIKLLGLRTLGPRSCAARPAVRWSRRVPHPLSPSEFPRARSAGGKKVPVSTTNTPPMRPKRRPSRKVQQLLPQLAGTPGGCCRGLANRHSPTKPNLRRDRVRPGA